MAKRLLLRGQGEKMEDIVIYTKGQISTTRPRATAASLFIKKGHTKDKYRRKEKK